jgi:hypothetical protein
LSVVSVITELAPLLPGVTLTGENAQEEPAGSPEQESPTALENVPPKGATLTENLAEPPRGTVALLGVTLTPKSTPVPLKPRLCGLGLLLSLTTSVPLLLPTAEGVNETLMAQLAPGSKGIAAVVCLSEITGDRNSGDRQRGRARV